MNKKYLYFLIIIVLALSAIIFFHQNSKTLNNMDQGVLDHINSKKDLIRVSSPKPGETISSPIKVSGEARGTWFFEATFPIIVVDWDGRIIGQSYATAQADWMTENFVPFEGTVTFDNPSFEDTYSKRGAIIFKKDNPSDLPEYDDALEIPIMFE